MYKRFVTTSFLFFIFYFAVFAQSIKPANDGKFHYKEENYKYDKMGHVFEQNEEANTLYLEALSSKKKAKTWGFISAGSATIGLIILATASSSDDLGDSLNKGFNSLLFMTASVVTLIPLITLSIKSGKRKKQSIDVFNQAYSYYPQTTNDTYINLVLNNGLGIVMTF